MKTRSRVVSSTSTALSGLALALFLAAPATGSDRGESSESRAGRTAKQVTRDIGHATRDAAKAVGHATRDITREIGHAFRDLGRKLRD